MSGVLQELFMVGYLHGYHHNKDKNNELLPNQDWELHYDVKMVVGSDVNCQTKTEMVIAWGSNEAEA